VGGKGLVGEAAAAHVVERRLAVPAFGQHAVIERDGRLECVTQPLAPRVLARRRSEISTPALAGQPPQSLRKSTPSRSMTKLKMSPPRPQPKHFHVSRAGVTVNEGVFSLWNGQRPLKLAPALRRADRFADQVGQVDLGFDLSGSADRRGTDLQMKLRAREAEWDRPPSAPGHSDGLVKS
jgi:hypothetical protein